MRTVKYKRGRLLVMATLCSVGAIISIAMAIYPSAFHTSIYTRLVTSGIGYYTILPALIAGSALMAYRLISLASGSRVALQFTPTTLDLHLGWGIKRLRWCDITDVKIQMYGNNPQLRVFSRGAQARLALPLTDLPQSGYQELASAIAASAGRGPLAQQPAGQPLPSQRGFGRRAG